MRKKKPLTFSTYLSLSLSLSQKKQQQQKQKNTPLQLRQSPCDQWEGFFILLQASQSETEEKVPGPHKISSVALLLVMRGHLPEYSEEQCEE